MIKLDSPTIIGILNCTPDSFYDGNRLNVEKRAEKALKMVENGADILDIGGESSRPGADAVSTKDEINRVVPVISKIVQKCQCPISIDTCKAEVAREALEAGAEIVNDISGCRDENMLNLVGEKKVNTVIMHMQGTPQNMQSNPQYDHVVQDIISYLQQQSQKLHERGLSKKQIIWDPGIGFGKLPQHNIEILKNLNLFMKEGHDLWLGVSRKSFIAHIHPSAKEASMRLPGSLAVLGPAYAMGVRHFRVHDVEATKQYFNVLTSINDS